MGKNRLLLVGLFSVFVLNACADANVPEARNVDIPPPISAQEREEAVNERNDSVMYLPLGQDVLVPERLAGDTLPNDFVGPFELRGETLAGALQLILADYDVSIAFETDQGLTRQVTVANLRGPLDKVIHRVCSLADLYCSYEDEALVVKNTQTFTVTLPPLTDADGNEDYITDIIQGLTAIIGSSGTAPVSDPTTRSLIYSATQRTAKLANNYFQRLRANTAMIVFETYIWEVSLNGGNSTGIDWSAIESFGKFNTNITVNGSVGGDFLSPISIGLPTTQATSPSDVLNFLSQFGAVKTISQPKITVLSGANAELRVADTQNYVSEVSQTINGDNTTTSVDTDSVDSGFTLTIGSSWDKSTVYANVNINLTNVDDIEDFTFSDGGDDGTDTIIQLPQTTERELTTQIRMRPGDAVLIAGLVRERDNFDSQGLGFMRPVLPDSRTAQTENLELVVLLKPRVVVYTDAEENRFKQYHEAQNQPISQEVYMPSSLKRKIETPVQTPSVSEAPKKSLKKAMKAEPVIVEPEPAPVPPTPEPIIVEPREEVVVAPEPLAVVEPEAEIVEEVEVMAAPEPVVVKSAEPVFEPVSVTEEVIEEPQVIVPPPQMEELQEVELFVAEPEQNEVPMERNEVFIPKTPVDDTARAQIIINNEVDQGLDENDSIPVYTVPEDVIPQEIVDQVMQRSSNPPTTTPIQDEQSTNNPYTNSTRSQSPRVSVSPRIDTTQSGASVTRYGERVSPNVETE